MIPNRLSGASRNDEVQAWPAPPRHNAPLVREALEELGGPEGAVLLVGGNDLLHFRLRVAQSHSRHDHLPSYWSHVGVLTGRGAGLRLHEAPLDPPDGFRGMPASNGVRASTLEPYDEAERFPNVAVLRFPLPPGDAGEAVRRVGRERGLLPLARPLLSWLTYLWGAASGENPLTQATGIPSAQFVEAVYAALGFELTPGLETAASNPEAVWQSAIYWQQFFETLSRERRPARKGRRGVAADRVRGFYWLGQPAAAVVEHGEAPAPPPRRQPRRTSARPKRARRRPRRR